MLKRDHLDGVADLLLRGLPGQCRPDREGDLDPAEGQFNDPASAPAGHALRA